MNNLEKEIETTLVNENGNACPLALRLAWHACGTFSKHDGTGGSNGATMRFPPEKDDVANNGLDIARDILKPVEDNNSNVSTSDIWALAGKKAIELTGGPPINFSFGRTDKKDGNSCPPIGRLPDGEKGAQHLREVFYRMGFNDQEIVALSGAHTLGKCHEDRSGFEGPWTSDPLRFDNEYFKNLLEKKWTLKEWDGKPQFVDETNKLMMLPTDIALINDDKFRTYVELYAYDQNKFFEDFSKAFYKLQKNGCKNDSVSDVKCNINFCNKNLDDCCSKLENSCLKNLT